MTLFPLFLKLYGRLCVVVGGGRIAESKTEGLLAAGARIRVVATEVTPGIARWQREGKVEWRKKRFEPGDLAESFLVIAATSIEGVNDEVFRQAEAQGILCNAVDDPRRCHFYYPAVVRRGALQIAISTGGLSPALAQRLRRELEDQFGPEYAPWLEWLGAARDQVRAAHAGPEDRRKILHHLASRETFEKFLRSRSSKRVKERAAR